MRRKGSRRRLFVDIVRQRLGIIFEYAVKELREGRAEEARRLTSYMKRLSQRSRVRIPRHMKRMICKHCGAPLIPGLSASVRARRQGRVSYMLVRCTLCGYLHRRPYDRHRTRLPRDLGSAGLAEGGT